MQKISGQKKINSIAWRLIAFPVIMIYMEWYFHMYVYENAFASGGYPYTFGIAIGFAVGVLTCIFGKIANAIVCYAFLVLITFIYISQMIYYSIFRTFYGASSFLGAKDALDFKGELFDAMKNNLEYELGMLLPLVVMIILGIVVFSFHRPKRNKVLIMIGSTVLCVAGSILSLNLTGRDAFSPYYLFHENFILELSMNKLGVPITMAFDLSEVVFGTEKLEIEDFNEEYITIDDVDEKGYEPQVDSALDLKKIYDNSDNENIKDITAYVSNRKPTYKNAYTGMYAGYNVIFITAESLSPYVVREDWMPMLYKMMNEGFVFENYYNPLWNKSTIDGEFVNCLSQYPSASAWSLYDSSDTYQPYALGNMLNNYGYTSKAYHDYDFYYYDRSKTHANLGYDFKAIRYGLELPSQDSYYSDLEMVETAYDEFTASEPFNAYFMTYSGHLPYNYEENAIARKNRAEAERLTDGMPYDDATRAYLAAQLELEYALEYLVDRLDEDGKLDHTLFVISPDHYPYTKGYGFDYNTLAQASVTENEFKISKSCFAIWNNEMEKPVKVDKTCASVDILPTVLNLLGVTYDSRLLMGRDILYEEEGYVIFPDHSYLTAELWFDAQTLENVNDSPPLKLDKAEPAIDLSDVEQMCYISRKIIEEDYFRYIYKEE